MVGGTEWDGAPVAVEFSHGRVLYMNDSTDLYLLIDVTGDTVNELGAGDYFWLAVDVNENGLIDANTDVQYGTYRDSTNMGLQYFLGPGRWTSLQSTISEVSAGFGGSPASPTPHVIWEFALRLSEIQAGPGEQVRIGIRVSSATPRFTDDLPADFAYGFGDLIEFTLGSR
jgi:hypothetical protein